MTKPSNVLIVCKKNNCNEYNFSLYRFGSERSYVFVTGVTTDMSSDQGNPMGAPSLLIKQKQIVKKAFNFTVKIPQCHPAKARM